MITTEQTRESVHRFRDEVDVLYSLRRDMNRLVKETLDSIVNAIIGAIESHSTIIDLDIQNRQRLWSGVVSEEEYSSVEMVANYLAGNWLVGSKGVLLLIDRHEVLPGDERVERLRELVAGMEASLRAIEVTDRTMGQAAMAMEQSAIEEHRRGETEAFL